MKRMSAISQPSSPSSAATDASAGGGSSPSGPRWPIIPTLIVAAAVAVMIGLGVWQLQRGKEKDALIALYQRNQSLSAAVMLPVSGPVPRDILFRHASAQCLRVTNWRQVGGRDIDGTTGFRFLAECSRSAEGPGFVADLGVSADPAFVPSWAGGPVAGVVTEEPVEGGLWAQLMGHRPVARPMIVASAQTVTGLKPSAPPNPSDVSNNHLAYAVQWFFFALAAAVIYVLAVRRRRGSA